MNKMPFPKKLRASKGDKALRHLKYAALLVLIAGIPLGYFSNAVSGERTLNAPLAIGLAMFVLLCVVTSRPFCKYLCPVGAVLGLTNLLPWGRYKINHDGCVGCGACAKACKMDIDPVKTPNSVECVRCGKCKRKCPTKAITSGKS
jgi:polyferredoxin